MEGWLEGKRWEEIEDWFRRACPAAIVRGQVVSRA